jgi:hypothetical protein
MGHLLLELPYAGYFSENTSESVSVFVGARLLRVQLATGELTVSPSERVTAESCDGQQGHRLEVAPEQLRSGITATLRETPEGPETLFSRAGRETLVPRDLRRSWIESDSVLAGME